MTQATVVVPTFNHGPTLYRSVGSALAQSVEDIEVFIVGDGVPDATRAIAADLMKDGRVRFFDNPKGPRHGEIHRHAALAEARGRIVCYLGDDDLWLPEHVETMLRCLEDADFAHAPKLIVEEDGRLMAGGVDLGIPIHRTRMLAPGAKGVTFSFSCGAHTLAIYRRLPHGWRTTPDGIATDRYMWQQILSQPGCRAVGSERPTVLHFPDRPRRGWTIDQRLAELDDWAARMSEPGLVEELTELVARSRARDADKREVAGAQREAELHARLDAERARTVELRGLLEQEQEKLASVSEKLVRERQNRVDLSRKLWEKVAYERREVARLEAQVARLRAQLAGVWEKLAQERREGNQLQAELARTPQARVRRLYRRARDWAERRDPRLAGSSHRRYRRARDWAARRAPWLVLLFEQARNWPVRMAPRLPD
jgi:GalNAc5-diNAcBac-PP-undecaprenol beta-1,3-glucosyltransferase